MTHDVEEALFLADRILIMSAKPGKIVEEIVLPFGRERDIETLAEHPRYSEIKHHVLHRVRRGKTAFRLNAIPGGGQFNRTRVDLNAMSVIIGASEVVHGPINPAHTAPDEYL